jgi:hypothetical protein
MIHDLSSYRLQPHVAPGGRLMHGINHKEIVSAPAAVAAIADDVAKAGSGS